MTKGGKENFSDSQRDSHCLQTSKECFSRHALNDIHSLGLNELMTKDYSPYFQDRKTRAKGETARSQTSWGAIVLKMRCRFQILGLYGECRLTCELSFLLLKKKKKSRTHSSQKRPCGSHLSDCVTISTKHVLRFP